MRYFFLFLGLGIPLLVIGQPITGPQIVQAAIDQHDPNGNWDTTRFTMDHTSEVEQDGKTSVLKSIFTIDNAQGTFECKMDYKGHIYQLQSGAAGCSGELHPENTGKPGDVNKRFMGCEGASFMRNYYSYLLGVPMKLKDPGTIIANEINAVNLEGNLCYEVKITYDPTVGNETWLFYFQQHDYRLLATRFYRDQETKSGELIYYRNYSDHNGLHIPSDFEWIIMPEETFLANDHFELID